MEDAVALASLGYDLGKGGYEGYKWLSKKPKKYAKKKRYVKKNRNVRNTLASVHALNRQMKALKTAHNADVAKHTHRRITPGSLLSAVNEQSYTNLVLNRTTDIETALTSCRFFDSAVPNTLVTASLASGTYSRKVDIKNIHSRVEFRNNYQIPCKAVFYVVTPKGDTSQTPRSSIDTGLADQMITTAGREQIGVFPTDIDMFNSTWKIVSTTKKELGPGQTCTITWNSGQFQYNPSVHDTETESYQKENKSALLLVRLEGVIGHDTVGVEGICQAQLDYVEYTTYKYEYDAGGVALNDITFEDSLSAFTGNPLVSQRPVADNQSYSVS